MHSAATPAEFLAVVAIVVVLLLAGTVMGRWALRRIAIGLALIAVAAVLLFDTASPFA